MRQLGTVASSVASVLHASHWPIAAFSMASRNVLITSVPVTGVAGSCVRAIVVS